MSTGYGSGKVASMLCCLKWTCCFPCALGICIKETCCFKRPYKIPEGFEDPGHDWPDGRLSCKETGKLINVPPQYWDNMEESPELIAHRAELGGHSQPSSEAAVQVATPQDKAQKEAGGSQPEGDSTNLATADALAEPNNRA